jgi:tRNA pseudouridine38-40 synthase
MPRYFIEVSYHGAQYSGFQAQHNANTVQAEVEKALNTYYRKRLTQLFPDNPAAGFALTGSSRTDAGVHARQNFFHVDTAETLAQDAQRDCYHLNAILPADIVLQNIHPVAATAHCRFDATARRYHYHLYRHKDPFLAPVAYYYPFKLDMERLQAAAALLPRYEDFGSFSKRNSQVHTHICTLHQSEWAQENGQWIYKVTGNRFLRGMVRGLVGTMLLVGRQKIGLEQFEDIIRACDCTRADFSVPGQGLFLMEVRYPTGYFEQGEAARAE